MTETYLYIHALIPDAEGLLAQEPEELARVFMQSINAMPQKYKDALNPKELIVHSDVEAYPVFTQGSVKKALMEAWGWLDREGFVAPLPDDDQGLYFITRKGQRVAKADEIR